MVSATQAVDEQAYAALEKLPRNPFHKFVRIGHEAREREREAFENTGHCPLFDYPRADELDVATYIRALDRLRDKMPSLLAGQPILEDLYLQKIDELEQRARLVRSVQEHDDEQVTTLSENIFSPPLFRADELEKELSAMRTRASAFYVHEPRISRSAFIRMVRSVLEHYDMNEWTVGVTQGSSVKIKHGHHDRPPKILVPKSFRVSKNRAARLLTHEIEVHALRTENGRKSCIRLLGRGLDRYLATEEGLAIYYQQQLSAKEPAHAPGFWDAYTNALTREYNFAGVYDRVRRPRTEVARKAGHPEPENKGRDAAWNLCLRAYRGIHNTGTKGVGYRRDHIYRSGLVRVQKALETKKPHLLQILFRGNIGLEHVERISRLDLPNVKLPELVSKRIIESRP